MELWSWRAETVSPGSADALLRAVTEAMRFLADYPQSGRLRDDLRPGLRSHPVKNYIIFYEPLPDGILVVRVLYGGRDIAQLFEDDMDDAPGNGG